MKATQCDTSCPQRTKIETFKEAKQRLINELAKPFAKSAAKVFEKMEWTWAGILTAEIHPHEKEIVNAICTLLDLACGKLHEEEADKLGHHYCATGRICISMFKWDHSKQWDIHLTLSP